MSPSKLWRLVIVLVGVTAAAVECFNLRVMRLKMSNDEHAGMDGGHFSYGEFYMKICSGQNYCCTTGKLNTEDNNWERGEQNFFIGRQLGGCESHLLSSNGTDVTIQHRGSDAGKIEWIRLRGSVRGEPQLLCRVDQKLDHDQSTTVPCVEMDSGRQGDTCNGDARFCSAPVNAFTFPGSHNAGTGQADRILDCKYKNHDLNVREQLDFGTRFFDFDIIYSTRSAYCNGLETGHGAISIIYQCFGKVDVLLKQMKEWMVENPREVVFVHFGELDNEAEAYPALKETLAKVFPPKDSMLNTKFQDTGAWPTLGESIASGKRMFVMVRLKSTSLEYQEDDRTFTKVVKVSGSSKPHALPRGAVTVLSTYGKGEMGSECHEIVDRTAKFCRTLYADFVKVATYGLRWNLDCVSTMARMCNPLTPQILDACKRYKPIVNFLFADFPNYPASSPMSLPEIAEKENIDRLSGL